MRKLRCFIAANFILYAAFANVAQPGMWNTGYGSRFTVLFENDSIYFGKVQMQKELVLINLYPGFAAVKGEYHMYNTTNKAITMTVGYPVNGSYDEKRIGSVMYEDLYNLKVLVNGQQVKTANSGDSLIPNSDSERWYYWKTTFAPNAVTNIAVYFLTDNSRANLRRGYNTSKGNAFTYILESGRAWGGNIATGDILIQLNDGLTLENIRGVLPDSTLKSDGNLLKFSFDELEPFPNDNILIWYDGRTEDGFDFKTISQNAGSYFSDLDDFPITQFRQASFKTQFKDNFKVRDTASMIFWAVAIGIVLIALAIATSVGYLIYKLVQKTRNKGTTGQV